MPRHAFPDHPWEMKVGSLCLLHSSMTFPPCTHLQQVCHETMHMPWNALMMGCTLVNIQSMHLPWSPYLDIVIQLKSTWD